MTIPFNNLAPALAEIRGDIDAAVKRVVDSSVFLGGDEVAAFESDWAAYCGTKYCVACASGTDALMLATRCGEFSGYTVPANTCRFTYTAIHNRETCDAKIVDVNDRGWQVSYEEYDIIVLLYGRMIPPELVLQPDTVVDACQAHGWKPQAGIKACYSFYPTKNLGCFGDGGAVMTDNPSARNCMSAVAGWWHSRMSELNAAVLRTKLPHLDRWNAERHAIAAVYYDNLPDWAEPVCRPGEPTNHHIFAVLVDRRDELEKHMLANGVGVKCHYREPLADLPGAVRWCSRCLSLPMFPGLTAMQVREVCDVMRTFR